MIRNMGRGRAGKDGVDSRDGADGANSSNAQLIDLMTPLVPTAQAVAALVEPGHTPTNAELNALITPLIPAPIAGAPGYKFAKRLTTTIVGVLVVDLTSAGFAVGTVPLCNCIAIAASSTVQYLTMQLGEATATSVTFLVRKFAALSINLVDLTSLSLFEATPGAIPCDVFARQPTP